MYKALKWDIHWFDTEEPERPLRASVSQGGMLRLGKSLQRVLPRDIRMGFDQRHRMLAIQDGGGEGRIWPSCGCFRQHQLWQQLHSLGLQGTVSFVLYFDPGQQLWLGRLTPRRTAVCGKDGKVRLRYSAENLLNLYQHLVDICVYQLAKTTPLSERKATANAAVCEVAESYRPWKGELTDYLVERVRKRLLENNKQYTSPADYGHRSLEAPAGADQQSELCLLDVLPQEADTIGELEDSWAEEAFLQELSTKERQLFLMIQEGYSVEEIKAELQLKDSAVMALGAIIGRKRQLFLQG